MTKQENNCSNCEKLPNREIIEKQVGSSKGESKYPITNVLMCVCECVYVVGKRKGVILGSIQRSTICGPRHIVTW